MDRTQVVLSAGAVEAQRVYIRRLADLCRQRPRPPLALVETYGCQQNVADSQRIMGMLRDMGCGFTRDAGGADIIVINTCAIRENAEKKVFGVVGQLIHAKERNPDLTICLCGCMAQQEVVAEKIKRSYRHVDLVFGPQALWKFPELLYRVLTEKKRVFSIAQEHGSIAEGLPVVRESSVKAWVSIMYGCNNFCSYCIVPYVRGRERSREAADIQMNIQELQFIARESLPITIVILNNQALGMIRHFQEMYFDDHYYLTVPSGGYNTPNFGKIARAYGIPYLLVEKCDDIAEIDWDFSGPRLVEIRIDEDTYVFPKLEFGKPNQDQEPLLERELYDYLMEL